jgi:hypothetical protein
MNENDADTTVEDMPLGSSRLSDAKAKNPGRTRACSRRIETGPRPIVDKRSDWRLWTA